MDFLKRIACINFVEADGYAYFSDKFYNGWYKVELKTGATTFLGHFENEKLSQRNIHREIFLRDHKIYVCPWKGRHVHIWNLADQTFRSIEIRRKDEEAYFIEEVFLGEKSVFFVPDSPGFPIKKMDLESLSVTGLSAKYEIQGEALSKSKDIFPNPELIEEYHIEYPEEFFWRKISDREWYAFRIMGCHSLHYVTGWNKLEITPLIVVNRNELEEHLYRVKNELLRENLVLEESVRFHDLLKVIEMEEAYKTNDLKRDSYMGEKVWNYIKG